GDHLHRNVSSPFTRRAMAGVRLERDRRGRGIRGAISQHERGQVGGFDGRGNGAALVPSRERVVLSRRLREPRGRRSKYYSEILARPLHSTLFGRGIHVLPLYPQVCGGPRRPALLDDSPAGDRHTRQADRCGELVRGAQGEVAEMNWLDCSRIAITQLFQELTKTSGPLST